MKKLAALLALVLVLCLSMGVALAETTEITFNYADYILITNKDGTNLVKFKSNEIIGYDNEGNEKYEFQEWKVKKLAATFADEVNADDKGTLWKVTKAATCTADAVVELIPQRGDTPITKDLLLTNNPADDVTETVSDDDKVVTGYSYYLYSKAGKSLTVDELLKMMPTRDAKELKKTLKAKGHVYDKGQVRVISEATCTEPGKVVKICDECEAEAETIVTDALGHTSYLSAQEVAKLVADGGTITTTTEDGKKYTYTLKSAPNCSANGSYTGTCAVCGSKNVTFSISNKAYKDVHKMGAWQTEKAATCTAPGMEYRLCTLCLKAKEERFVEALGHDYVADSVTAATCTTTGLATKITCSRCSIVVIAKNGELHAKKNDKANAPDADDAEDILADMEELGYTPATGDNSGKINTPTDPKNHPAKYWVLTEEVKATCTKAGKMVYTCSKCEKIANTVTIPKTGHDVKVVYVYWDPYTQEPQFSLVPTCLQDEDGDPVQQYKVTFCCNLMKDEKGKFDLDKIDYYEDFLENIDECGYESKWEDVINPAHTWTEWIERNAPADDTPGYWIRECKVCKMNDEYIGYTAPDAAEEPKTEEPKTEEPKTEEPKTEEPKTEEPTVEPKEDGVNKDEDGKYRVYKDGEVDETATGIVEYDGAKFFCTKGVLDTDYSGLALYNDTWYFLAAGKISAPTHPDGVASYDGSFFKVKEDGTIDTSATGVYDFDGGKFAFSDGQINTSINGLYFDPISKEFVFCSAGQVQTQFTGVAEYDGSFFVLKDGKLDDKDGYYEYDGAKFIISHGQLYPMPADAETPAEETPTVETEPTTPTAEAEAEPEAA